LSNKCGVLRVSEPYGAPLPFTERDLLFYFFNNTRFAVLRAIGYFMEIGIKR
jgi:hypothetical protein